MYKNIIKDGQLMAKWRDDSQRRDFAMLYLDYYNGVYKDILNELIDLQIRDVVESKDLKYFTESEGMTEWMIKEIALVFAEACEFVPTINEKVIDSKSYNEKFQKFLIGLDVNVVLENIDRYVELLHDVAVTPIYANGRLSLKILTPEKCVVYQHPDDPTQMEKFLYQIGIAEDSPTNNPIDEYMCYDMSSGQLESYKCTLLNNGQIDQRSKLPIIDPKSKINIGTPKYDRIPVVMFRNYLQDDSFWFKGNSDIVDKSIATDMRRTDIAMTEAYMISQLLTTGLSDKTFKNMVFGRTSYINIPFGDDGTTGDAKYLSPPDNLKSQLDAINARRKTLARNKGLSGDTIDGVTATSGYQLALSKAGILTRNKSKRKYYTKPINDIILLAIETANYYNLVNLTKVDAVVANYGELEILQSPEELARTRLAKTLAGVWSPVQSLMEDDPELTEEMAVEKLKQIKAWNAINAPTNPFEDEKDPNKGK